MKHTFLLILFFSLGCLKQSEPIVSEKIIYIYPTLDFVYDLALQNDTLYVANGESGIKVFKIVNEGDMAIESLYEGIAFSEEENIINIEFSQVSGILFALDKFNYTYAITKSAIFDLGLSFMKGISDCSQYQSKSIILDDSSTPDILTLYRKIDQFDENNRSTVIGKVGFSDLYYFNGEDCTNDILIDFNYRLTDLDFNNDRLYLSNANRNILSINVYDENEGDFSFAFEDTLLVEPLTVSAYQNTYVVGLDNNAGCYIALLDVNGIIEGKFSIADGFTIRDIHYSNNLLVLSAGYGGVLVYDWDGETTPTQRAMIASGYAYSTLVYENNKIIVGTKNGIEIYEI